MGPRNCDTNRNHGTHHNAYNGDLVAGLASSASAACWLNSSTGCWCGYNCSHLREVGGREAKGSEVIYCCWRIYVSHTGNPAVALEAALTGIGRHLVWEEKAFEVIDKALRWSILICPTMADWQYGALVGSSAST